MARIEVNPNILRWALERADLKIDDVENQFKKIHAWLVAEAFPTLTQLRSFASKTKTPLGYFFLKEPPQIEFPIPMFRTVGDKKPTRPSPDLFDTVCAMQRRQDWMHDYLVEEGEKPLSFVGSVTVNSNVKEVANQIRDSLGLRPGWANDCDNWMAASRLLRDSVDNAGILVMRSGVVGTNNWRPLNVEEFRGFVLIDEYTPLIFINGVDFPNAQQFTVAHELAHVWLGFGSAFNLLRLEPYNDYREEYCNKVAAEFLAPEDEFRTAWASIDNARDKFAALSVRFKISQVVAARRARGVNLISQNKYFEFYNAHRAEWLQLQDEREEKRKKNKQKSGNFYNTQGVRIGKRFGGAIYHAAKAGRVTYLEAYRLTGLRGATFD